MTATAAEAAGEAPGTHIRSVAWLAIALVVTITARWIWIGGLGDFGWTYETAARIAEGQVYYRDFISALPPLTSYALAFGLMLVGNIPFAWALQLYAWWLALGLASALLLRRLELFNGRTCVAVAVAMVSCEPAFTLGHSYNYAAAVFSAAALFVLAGAGREGPDARRIAIAGLWAGTAFLAKQNVGAALVVSIAFLQATGPGVRSARARRVVGFAFAAAIPVLLFLGYFAVKGAGLEAVRQLLLDGSEGKGGLAVVLGRAIPRIVLFDPRLPARRLLEGAMTLAVAIATVGWLSLRAPRITAWPPQWELDARVAMAVLVGLYAGLAAVSLVPLASGLTPPRWPLGIIPFYLLLQVVYIALVVTLAGLLLRLWCSRRLSASSSWISPAQAIVLVLALLAAAATSSSFYIMFALPLVVPVIAGLLRDLQRPFPSRLPVLLGCLFIATGFLPGYAQTFVRLEPLAGPLAPYWGSSPYARFYNAIAEGISPQIDGQPTLWLMAGGPHAAFGGRSVFNVSSYFSDTYTSRSEQALAAAFRDRPPAFVVLGAYTPAARAVLLAPDRVRTWIGKTHQLVWTSGTAGFPPGRFLELWQKR